MRVDFYDMSGRFSDPLKLAAVLVGKAWPAAGEVVIVGDRARIERLDGLLWHEPAGRFLPHGIDDPVAPIRLTAHAPVQATVLINLEPCAELPDGHYDRVLEIVPPDKRMRRYLRQRWATWKARGAQLHHHILK